MELFLLINLQAKILSGRSPSLRVSIFVCLPLGYLIWVIISKLYRYVSVVMMMMMCIQSIFMFRISRRMRRMSM